MSGSKDALHYMGLCLRHVSLGEGLICVRAVTGRLAVNELSEC